MLRQKTILTFLITLATAQVEQGCFGDVGVHGNQNDLPDLANLNTLI